GLVAGTALAGTLLGGLVGRFLGGLLAGTLLGGLVGRFLGGLLGRGLLRLRFTGCGATSVAAAGVFSRAAAGGSHHRDRSCHRGNGGPLTSSHTYSHRDGAGFFRTLGRVRPHRCAGEAGYAGETKA